MSRTKPLPPEMIRISPTGTWGRYFFYMAKIGTHGSTVALIRRARSFWVGQLIYFCELRDVQGMCIGCTPKWQHGQVSRITSDRIFIDR